MNTFIREIGVVQGFPDSITVGETTVKRSDFGNAKPGKLAWTWVLAGVPCEAVIQGEICGIPMIGTTDYDVLGDLEQKPHCSEEHHLLIKRAVEKDLEENGSHSTVGRNGCGRG